MRLRDKLGLPVGHARPTDAARAEGKAKAPAGGGPSAAAGVRDGDRYAGVVPTSGQPIGGRRGESLASALTAELQQVSPAMAESVVGAASGAERAVGAATRALTDAGDALTAAGELLGGAGEAVRAAGDGAGAELGRLAAETGRALGDARVAVTEAGRVAARAGLGAAQGEPALLDGARLALGRAHRVVTESEAHTARLGTRAGELGSPRVAAAASEAAGVLGRVRTGLQEAAHALGDAVRAVVNTPRAVLDAAAKVVADGGDAVRTALVSRVRGGPQLLAGLEQSAAGAQEVRLGLKTGDAARIGRGLHAQARGLAAFSWGLWQAGSPMVNYARDKVAAYAQGFNVNAQVAALKPGESYEVRVGGDVHVELGAEASGTFRATRAADGTYEIVIGGQAGLNGYLEFGGKLGPAKAYAETSVHGLAGGSLLLACRTPEEAQRAVEIMEKLAMRAGTGALGGLGGMLAGRALGPSDDDLAFLKAHATGVELTGTLGAEAAGALGLARSSAMVGLSGAAGLAATTAVRLDFKEGRPTGVTVSERLTGFVEAQAGLALRLGAQAAAGTGASPDPLRALPVMTGAVEVALTVETSSEFPEGASAEELTANPLGALKKYAKAMRDTAVVTVGCSLEGDAGGVGPLPGGTVAAELTATGVPAQGLDEAALRQLLAGDFAGAAARLGSKVAVTGRVDTVQSKSWGLDDFEVDAFGAGFSATFAAEKRQLRPLVEVRGTGAELVPTWHRPSPEGDWLGQ